MKKNIFEEKISEHFTLTVMPHIGKQPYIEIAFTIEAEHHEMCIALLASEGVESFLEEDQRLLAYLPQSAWAEEKMQAILVDEDTVYQTNQWGITEPTSGASLDLSEIDLVLVPLLVFDESGYRVGYGKGFYDRFLEHKEAYTQIIGFSYFDPVPLISDTHEFDIPLHIGITPKRVYEF